MNIRSLDYNVFFRLSKNREKIMFLLQYAVLAPSTHNSQPWLFKIRQSSCEIYFNPDKMLPEADKKKRNLYLSLGCCIENLIIASKYFNIYKKIEYKLSGNEVATIYFQHLKDGKATSNNKKNAALFNAIGERTTNRGLYMKKSLPERLTIKLEKLTKDKNIQLSFLTKKHDKKIFKDLTVSAIKKLYRQKEFRTELSNWIYPSIFKKYEGIPCYALRLPIIISIFFPFVLRTFNISSVIAKINSKSLESMQAVCIINIKKNNRRTWLVAGRVAQRALLFLSSKKVDSYITIAAVDYGQYYKKIQNMIGTDLLPVFSFGIGYSAFKKVHSPRFPPREKILNS